MTESTSTDDLIRRDALRTAPRPLPSSAAEYEELKRIRAAVQRRLTEDLERLLVPLGYARDGDTWRKSSALGRSAFQFQKSRHGFDAYFNASAGPRWPGRPLPLHRLAAFCPEMANEAPDALPYRRLDDDRAFRDAVLAVVRRRMIPWMETRHRLPGLPGWPSPAGMSAIRLFADA